VISVDDFLFYVDDALDQMTGILTGLGDELAQHLGQMEISRDVLVTGWAED